MTEYFTDALLESAKKQKNKNLAIYFSVVFLYLVITVICFIWYGQTPYGSKTLTTVKLIHYPVTVVFIAFSFLYIFIPLKRALKYYKKVKGVKEGRRETYEGVLLKTDENKITKDFVEFKSMLFGSENKEKGGIKERKIEIFYDDDYPDIKVGEVAKLTLCGNLLINYEIVQKGEQK